jgi:primosomal protein N' (replication factor Y)
VKTPKAPNIELLSELRSAKNYLAVAEVCVPNTTLESLSFGVNESVEKGAVVWVSLRGRKKPLLALVINTHANFPDFKLKPLMPHESGYAFSERYVEMLLWCASYYMCSLGEALSACWPAELEKYLCRR